MCFSAAASFSVGSILLLLGAGCLSLIPLRAPRSMTARQKAALATVAAIPLMFGGHQLSEGFVWEDFENDAAVKCFAFTAFTFWPFYMSLALTLTEWTRPRLRRKHWSYWPLKLSDKFRRWMLLFNLFWGTVLLVLGTVTMIPLHVENHVRDVNGRLHYEGWDIGYAAGIVASLAYLYVIISSMIVSSLPYSTLLGELGFVSLVVSFILWQTEFPSTWCFFAAILSSILILSVWNELQLYRDLEKTREAEQEGTSNTVKEEKGVADV